ncbi:MAG: hypothetical protein PHT60_04755 [Acidiphilium sp.]|nr:hypothetical protein [Acidiphilium sp.]MDD4935072.1 hypothetical protein [Acidiphilium sp.]
MTKTIIRSTLVTIALAFLVFSLGGCVYYPGYGYGSGYYGAPAHGGGYWHGRGDDDDD